MYIKRIVAITAILIACGLGVFCYYVYQSVFGPNTSFSQPEVNVYIGSNADYQDVLEELKPIVEDLQTFNLVAQKKGYPTDVIPGRFILEKGMNNNEIVNTLRSSNIPISVIFNNQESLRELAGTIAGQIEADSLSLIKAMTDSTFLSKHKFDPPSETNI